MKTLSWLAVLAMVSISCTSQPSAPAAPPAAAGPVPTPHANLAQVMRGIPFPASNLIFDTQTNDPAAAAKPGEPGSGANATAQFSGVYGGWQAVENSGLAIAETANLLLVPGRKCQNGKNVPNDREDFKKFTQGLVDAGMAAYKAAQSKNLDAMVEVSGTVSDACAACHEVYRDKPTDAERCG
jgi:hypothetical protein